MVESRAPCTRYPQTHALDWIRSYYSAVRVAILLSGPCRTVMSINNADVIKLLRSDRSSDTRALLFIYLFFFFFFFFNLTVVRGRRSSEGGLKMEEKTQVSEVGFEPGTFRSCVEHSNHYATETPPIPDVLLVLVAPKYINRNVTTTLQSRFTPTPTPQATHSSFIILFYYYYFILFYFILFYFILFYFCETSQYLALFAATIFPISTPTRTVRRSSDSTDFSTVFFKIPIF